jgi:hypothetical protein
MVVEVEINALECFTKRRRDPRPKPYKHTYYFNTHKITFVDTVTCNNIRRRLAFVKLSETYFFTVSVNPLFTVKHALYLLLPLPSTKLLGLETHHISFSNAASLDHVSCFRHVIYACIYLFPRVFSVKTASDILFVATITIVTKM